MMRVEKALNNGNVMSSLFDVDGISRRAIRSTWFDLGKWLKKEAAAETRKKNKTGRVYRVRGRRHRASAPGETHANLSGKLTKSMSWRVHGTTEMSFGYGVKLVGGGRGAPPYAGAIELGRKDGSIKARPTLQNQIDKSDEVVGSFFATALEREAKA